MNREEIIRMARGAVRLPEPQTPQEEAIVRALAPIFERFGFMVAAAERNNLAAWMSERGYATGHGDTIEDLLVELEWQVRESEREACAKACEQISNELSAWPFAYEGLTAETKFVQRIGETIGQPFIEAIRARGKP